MNWNQKSLYIFIILVGACLSLMSQSSELVLLQRKGFEFQYDLTQADKKTKVPHDLREISGIQYLGDGIIAAIEDEHGKIYLVDLNSGEIKDKIKFGDNGDYEDIAVINNTAWVLKSNGNLYRVKDFEKESELKTKKYETALAKKNDPEGLAFDKEENRLLIACKGHPFIEVRKGTHRKSIYSFDLDEKKLLPDPVLIIDLDTLKDLKDYNLFSSLGIRLMAYFDENKGDVTFQPSGIAVHPITRNYYIIGAVGDLLLVYSREGILLAVVPLPDRVFKQAEGICFDTNGDLYICNEGGDGKGNILKFKPKKQY